jgi:hypothetical protein
VLRAKSIEKAENGVSHLFTTGMRLCPRLELKLAIMNTSIAIISIESVSTVLLISRCPAHLSGSR